MRAPSFSVFQTSAGAQIFVLPLEVFPDFWACAYLVLVDDLCVLIDCGSGSEASNVRLEAGLERASGEVGRKLALGDLTHVLITHGHIDHYGGLAWLRGRTPAQFGAHELDLQTLSHHDERLALMSRRLEAFLGRAGVPDEQRGALLQMYRFTKALYRPLPLDFTYEAAEMRLGRFEMIHVPGHCPGHVAIRLDDAIFCGDLVLGNVTPHQSPEELTPFMGLHHYLDSLSLFQRWAEGARLILSGHDPLIPDLPGRIAGIRRSLTHRLRQALNAAAEPGAIAEICRKIYGAMDGYNALLVLEKTAAYVEYLYQRGLLGIHHLDEVEESGEEVVIRYHRLRDASDADILPKERAYVLV